MRVRTQQHSRATGSARRKRPTVAVVGALLGLLGPLTLIGKSSANTIATPAETIYDTDVVSAGLGGMRGSGAGSIALAGVTGTVTKALLFWQGPTDSADPAANAAVTFNGTSVTGTNIGLSSPNCWDYDNSQGYRADVTGLVSANGSYTLADFAKPAADANGASLIVFFDDGNDANNRDVVLFEGNDSNALNTYDADGWNATLPGITYSTGSASLVLHVSDGQSFADDALVLNGTDLVPDGPIFSGTSVPGAGFVATGGNLWDIKSYDVTSFLVPGPNSLQLASGLLGDCLSLVVAAIDLPVGAAPPADNLLPVITAPATRSGVYSDPIAGFGISAGDPDPGDTVALSASGLPSTLGLVDNGDGTGTVSGTPTVAAGLYTATWTANDGHNPDVTGTTGITIAREDCTLTSPPVVLGTASSPTTLSTNMGELDANLGDRSGKTVSFTATDAALNAFGPYPATTDANGDATTSVNWGPGVYAVSAAFGGDGFYNACATTTDSVVTVQDAAAKATGGGWTSIGTGRASFGFNAVRDVLGLHGQFQLRVTNKNRFHGNVVSSLTGTATTAQWSGTGVWNGQPGFRFSVSVVDNGSSGKKGDTISITIRNPANTTVVWSTDGFQSLKGGNIVVHK